MAEQQDAAEPLYYTLSGKPDQSCAGPSQKLAAKLVVELLTEGLYARAAGYSEDMTPNPVVDEERGSADLNAVVGQYGRVHLPAEAMYFIGQAAANLSKAMDKLNAGQYNFGDPQDPDEFMRIYGQGKAFAAMDKAENE